MHSAMGDARDEMAISVSDTNEDFSLWDRGQLIVASSRTRLIKKKNFVGNEMKQSMHWKDHWHIELKGLIALVKLSKQLVWVLNLLTALQGQWIKCISLFVYVSLSQDQTGAVFFLLSKRDESVHIASLQKKYPGVSLSSLTLHLRPYVLIAFIVGFERNVSHMEEIKEQWVVIDQPDVMAWTKSAQDITFVYDDL